jgi:hypothetical protein
VLTTTLAMVATAMVSSPSAHLLDPALLAQAEAPPALTLPPMNPEATPEQLRAEIRELEDLKPSLGLPITLLVVGGAVAVNGLALSLFGFLSTSFLYVGIVFTCIGAPMLIIGAVLLSNRIAERRQYNEEIELRETRLRLLERTGPRSPDSPFPPPQVRGPESPLLLATF